MRNLILTALVIGLAGCTPLRVWRDATPFNGGVIGSIIHHVNCDVNSTCWKTMSQQEQAALGPLKREEAQLVYLTEKSTQFTRQDLERLDQVKAEIAKLVQNHKQHADYQ